jgi:hypothetical protein
MVLLRGKYLVLAAELTALIALQVVYLVKRRRKKPRGGTAHSVNGQPVVSAQSLNSQSPRRSEEPEFRYTPPPAAAPPTTE